MKVKFVPQNIELEIKPGQSVMHLAHDNGIHIKSVCKGIPSCAECRVRVVEGEYNVLPPASPELSLIGTAYFVDQRRLSCQLKCFGDITVDLTEQIEKAEQVAKRPRGRHIKEDQVESFAIAGSIVLEEALSLDDDEPATESQANATPSQSRQGRNSGGKPNYSGDPKSKPKKDFYSGFSGPEKSEHTEKSERRPNRQGGAQKSSDRAAGAQKSADRRDGTQKTADRREGPQKSGNKDGPKDSSSGGNRGGRGGRGNRRRR